jgi:hypothetical protein
VEQQPVRQEAQSRSKDPGFAHEHMSLIFANLCILKVSFRNFIQKSFMHTQPVILKKT